MLNKHCPYCAFHQRCHAEAMAKDDLSLLRGLSAKDITQYHKHGIFTVTQLSCTFRPRKRRKPAPPKPPLHQAALQALAIRDQKIHVYGTPQLPVSSTRIYFDLEGDPDRRFVYLLGMVVQTGAVEER
jgi:predicted RecB family nuclease